MGYITATLALSTSGDMPLAQVGAFQCTFESSDCKQCVNLFHS